MGNPNDDIGRGRKYCHLSVIIQNLVKHMPVIGERGDAIDDDGKEK